MLNVMKKNGILLFTLILIISAQGIFPHMAAAADQPDKAQMAERGEYLTIKILTVGQGDSVYLWYGHIAIIVEDSLRNTEVLYDYGVFNFKQDNFFRNFAMGRLIYGVVAAPAAYRISQAEYELRNMTAATLNIPPEKRYEVAIFLQENVKPGNNTYLYHHYNDNCSTRVRDVINMAVDGQLKVWAEAQPGKMSLREHIHRHSGNNFFMDWVLNFLQSDVIDTQISLWDDMFLPEELNQNLLNFYYTDASGNSVKLVSNYEVLTDFPERKEVPPEPAKYWPVGIAVGILIGFIGLILYILYFKTKSSLWRAAYGTYTACYGLLFGFFGTALLLMMIFTNQDVTFNNENVLLASPVLLWAGILGILIAVGKKKFIRLQKLLFTIQGISGILLLLLKGIAGGVFDQQNWLTLSLLIPSLLLMSRFWMKAD
ncbi:MAG: DUF4105 domain-containing protein [Bacteroidetes bacterium]|nr:DUF4105 domain-containing protein [Bacteroidota bacterium]